MLKDVLLKWWTENFRRQKHNRDKKVETKFVILSFKGGGNMFKDLAIIIVYY